MPAASTSTITSPSPGVGSSTSLSSSTSGPPLCSNTTARTTLGRLRARARGLLGGGAAALGVALAGGCRLLGGGLALARSARQAVLDLRDGPLDVVQRALNCVGRL